MKSDAAVRPWRHGKRWFPQFTPPCLTDSKQWHFRSVQHALHATQNELEVVDPSTNQRYVIVAKDRWVERTAVDPRTSQDRAVPGRHSDSIEPWTDDKNRRRAELVDRQIGGTLTAEERAELERLQQQMRALPRGGARQIQNRKHGE